MTSGDALGRVSDRVRLLAATYEPPTFDHVPSADAALFMCAIDHKTGYSHPHEVEGRGPFEGSELMWELGSSAERRSPGTLSAASLVDIGADEAARLFRVDGETVAGADVRARLWRDLAGWLLAEHGGEAESLLASASRRLAGPGGLIDSLAACEAYADPLRKKAFLFAKVAERRGWFEVDDPENWEVCADNVLMRLALRSGLVEPGSVDRVRATTRVAFKVVAAKSGISPPVLDDLLWELGRDDPDLLGTDAGDRREPDRPAGSHWY